MLKALAFKLFIFREGKGFLVATTVSTVSTSTVCFVTAAAAACTRKKRNIVQGDYNYFNYCSFTGNHYTFHLDDVVIHQSNLEIHPQRVIDSIEDKEDDDQEEITSGLKTGGERLPRFFNLLYYATSTSTSTSFTGTSTLATLECTPSGYTLSAC